MDDYINIAAEGKLSWWSVICCSSDSGEALENWQNWLHEVSMMKYTRITKSLRWVGTEVCDLPTYEILDNLDTLLTEFEDKVLEPQWLLSLDVALKATSTRWWDVHKQAILEWPQCRRLLEIRFYDNISYVNKYIGLTSPVNHLDNYCVTWRSVPRQEWVHLFIHTLDKIPRNLYTSVKLQHGTID